MSLGCAVCWLINTGFFVDPNNQLVLPSLIATLFTAECQPATQNALPAGTATFPNFNYAGAALRDKWQIVPKQDQCIP